MGTGIILCLCAVRIELVICEARNIHSLAVCHGELHGTAGGVDSTTLYISIFTGNGIVHGIQLFLRCRPASFGEIGSFGIPVGEARDFSLRTIDGNGFGILAFADGDGIIQRQTVGGDICLFVGTRGDGEVTISLDLCALRIHRIDGMSICCIFGCYGSDIGTALHFRGRRLQLADIDGIRIIDAGSDVDDAAGQSFFSGLAHGLAYGNDAVTAVRGEDIPLGHLAAIAQGCGVSHAIRHGSMVAKGHVLAIACSGIHADSDAVIAGLCAIADGNGIILGCRFIADGHRVLSIGQGIDTSSQRICAFGTVIIVVALRRVCRLNAEEMGLRLLQLGHVHGVRIFCAGCHVRDLAGNLLIPCGITDRNSGRRRFPCTRSIRAVVFAIQIKAYYAFVRSSNRFTT